MPAALRLLLAVALLAVVCSSGCTGDPRPSLLLITIDTLRADHVSAYGYHRPTTPTLERLATDGVLFDKMFAPLPETGPSCATLLTGLSPARLGMRGNGVPLPPQFDTLATWLADERYETAAFVSGFPLTRRLAALDRGFDLFDDAMPDPRGSVPNVQRHGEKTTAAALAWLRGRGSRPFFAWVHYYDAHGDYVPGPPYASLFDDDARGSRVPFSVIPEYQRLGRETDTAVYVQRYDGEIRRVDDQVARLLAHLDETGRRSNTLVVVTADHGESLTEHGYYFDHGNELYMPSARVPFILAGPGVPARDEPVDAVSRAVDILPTMLDLLGVTSPGDLPGRSLVPLWTGGPVPGEQEALMEARFKPYRALTPGADVGPKLAARDDRFTVVLRLTTARVEVYDRDNDPGESQDLATALAATADGPALLRDLESRLHARHEAMAAGTRPEPLVFDERVRALLEAAGAGAGV